MLIIGTMMLLLSSLEAYGADFCTSRYPGNGKDGGKSNIDLSNWHLILPDAKSQKHPAAFHNDYFYSDENGDLWFCVPEGAAHTPGSKDPRTEMGESGFDAPLSQWKARSQTAKLKVLNVSSWGGPVIGQIHSNSCGHHECNAALKLRFDPPKITGKGYQIKAYVASDLKGGSTHLLVADDLKLGDPIEYKIELDFPNLKVTVNGHTASHSFDFYEKEKAEFFFKAGNYCDTEGKKDSEKGCLAVFSYLQTAHGGEHARDGTDSLLV